MKTTIYILTIMLLLSSCKSIDKMIESGNYDQALRYGVDKLRGNKNKKTKYVKALEKAYAKLNLQDRNQINHLELNGQVKSLDRIVDIYYKMEDRQNYVMPLLPLISEDGYLAEIEITDYSIAIHNASKNASQRHYEIGIKNLEYAQKTGNKKSAIYAYESFEDAQSYFTDYKNSNELKNEAYQLAQSRILVEPYIEGSNLSFDHTLSIISQININRLNSKWVKFYSQDDGKTPYDFIATVEVTDIIPGVERERYRSFEEKKNIVDGTVPLKNRNGRVVKDTSGNIIYTDKIIEVHAYIEELEREKIAHMNGQIIIVDTKNNSLINSVPINITHEFRDYSSIFHGDKRALTEQTNKRIKNRCEPFPSDYDIISTMAHAYKNATEETLYKLKFNNNYIN